MESFGKEALNVARGRAGLSFPSSPRHFLREGENRFLSLDANGLDGGCCDGDDVATGAGAGADVDDLVLGAEEGLCGECCGLDEGFQGGVEWRELRGLRRLVGWRWYFVWWFRFVW